MGGIRFNPPSHRRAEEKADVPFCDLSHTFVGALLPAVESFWNLNLSFEQALSRAWEIVGEKEQAIVVFTSLPGLKPYLSAMVFVSMIFSPLESWCGN